MSPNGITALSLRGKCIDVNSDVKSRVILLHHWPKYGFEKLRHLMTALTEIWTWEVASSRSLSRATWWHTRRSWERSVRAASALRPSSWSPGTRHRWSSSPSARVRGRYVDGWGAGTALSAHCSTGAAGTTWRMQFSWLVNRCFEPSKSLGIILGLKKTFVKRQTVERTNKAEAKLEEQSEKMESCRENLRNEIQLKGP